VARAKRTDRADARRRHRARLAEFEPESAAEPASADPAPPTARPARGAGQRASSQSSAAPASGPTPAGIGYAFRAAFRPPQLKEDLALLPQIVRGRAVWIPALISIVTTILWLTTGGRDVISRILVDYFVVTPPIGAIFIAGFLAKRASYLTGAIAGLVGAICLSVIVLVSPTGGAPNAAAPGGAAASGSPAASAAGGSQAPSSAPSAGASTPASPAATGSASAAPSAASSGTASASPAAASPTPSGTTAPPPTPEQIGQLIGAAFVISPLTGIFFGSAAAWYKRFLNLANPNRGQRRQQPNRGRPNRRR